MTYVKGQKLLVIVSCACKIRGLMCHNKGDIVEIRTVGSDYIMDTRGRIILKKYVRPIEVKSLDDFI